MMIRSLMSNMWALLFGLCITLDVLSAGAADDQDTVISADEIDRGSKPFRPPMSQRAAKIHAEISQTWTFYDNPELQRYVQALGEEMVANSDHAGRDYYFFVVDSPGVNAVTPGEGLVYVYRGLMTLLNSEAQLAGVLGHEIGHNIGKHLWERKRDVTLGNIGAIFAGLITGSTDVMNSVGLAAQERQSSAGREAELESDEYGANILYNAGYDPLELFAALESMADYGTYGRRYGDAPTQYHGTFSTHPRSDIRLQKLFADAGELPPGEARIGRERWREMLDGMVIGVNFNGNKRPDQERFLSRSQGVTFVYPNDWELRSQGAEILLRDADKTVQLKITAVKVEEVPADFNEALAAHLGVESVEVVPINDQDGQAIGAVGASGTKRVAVKRVGRYTYFFEGIARNNKITKEQDAVLLDIIKEFRRLTSADLPPEAVQRLYFKRLEPGETLASLAADIKGDPNPEQTLRLINGYFPRGEPEPGMWIKMFK